MHSISETEDSHNELVDVFYKVDSWDCNLLWNIFSQVEYVCNPHMTTCGGNHYLNFTPKNIINKDRIFPVTIWVTVF
jgi:hypothetical protein